ncbi:hypothetical protein [Campylobacter lari]|uniref:hypothetical protein n=1 Tax=Campylobacter lari TaxID=201 RepID=UPI001F09348D|nr:hypothetical protein [Campylobacter lari]
MSLFMVLALTLSSWASSFMVMPFSDFTNFSYKTSRRVSLEFAMYFLRSFMIFL